MAARIEKVVRAALWAGLRVAVASLKKGSSEVPFIVANVARKSYLPKEAAHTSCAASIG
jgi:hypothetical protein